MCRNLRAVVLAGARKCSEYFHDRKWCPRPDLNRHDPEVEGFSYHFGFRRRPWRTAGVRGLEHAFTLALRGCRCPPSALYTFPSGGGLGSALARAWCCPGRSPTLTGVTRRVSPAGLKLFQVPCVYRFHHSGMSGVGAAAIVTRSRGATINHPLALCQLVPSYAQRDHRRTIARCSRHPRPLPNRS